MTVRSGPVFGAIVMLTPPFPRPADGSIWTHGAFAAAVQEHAWWVRTSIVSWMPAAATTAPGAATSYWHGTPV
jgi:hypothetical protein